MLLPRPVAGVVFDMDGLLIDTEALWRDVQLAEAEAQGLHLPLQVIQSLIGQRWQVNRRILQGHFGPEFDVEAFIAAVSGRHAATCRAGVSLKTGVVELLDLLDELALPRAIATSSDRQVVTERLGPGGLLERFHAVVTNEDCVEGKPHPEPYLNAARALDLNPADCLALEDSYSGVRSAHAAGMMTVMVPDLLLPTEEIGGLCVAVAETLHQVRAALLAATSTTR
jgi:beta-phosphoglucomutase-like phosphatase (HAD superfamily)